MLPQRNAFLTKIERTGGTSGSGYHEDYDRPATDPESAGGEGADLWTGKVRAYLFTVRRRVTEGQTSRVLVERSLLLDPSAAYEFEFTNGDQLTIDHAGSVVRGQVAAVEKKKMPGVRGITRLTLEDA